MTEKHCGNNGKPTGDGQGMREGCRGRIVINEACSNVYMYFLDSLNY